MMTTMETWKTIIQNWQRYDPVTAGEEDAALAIVSSGNGHALEAHRKLVVTIVARYPIDRGQVFIDDRPWDLDDWSCKPLESWWQVVVSIDISSLELGPHSMTIHPRFSSPLSYKILAG